MFLGIGLAGVNALRAEGEDKAGVRDAVDFIAELRQTLDLSTLPVGRDVVVIGGGMTAVDAAVQSKLLGAENVTIVYRRGQEKMSASGYEQDHAVQAGVRIIHNAAPVRVLGNGAARGGGVRLYGGRAGWPDAVARDLYPEGGSGVQGHWPDAERRAGGAAGRGGKLAGTARQALGRWRLRRGRRGPDRHRRGRRSRCRRGDPLGICWARQ